MFVSCGPSQTYQNQQEALSRAESDSACSESFTRVRHVCQLLEERHDKVGSDVSAIQDQDLREALLDSWDRNNTIMVNLLRALPVGGLQVKAMEGGPNVAQLFTHIASVRLVFVFEDAPECATAVPEEEWVDERDPVRIAQMLNDSAKVVRDAVKTRLMAGRDMDRHYDHPILLLQHMLWHEGYHHGQIKLALKLAGRPLSNATAGPLTWRVWMDKGWSGAGTRRD
jgi:uncharacterized damage-inducible protein DinB